MKKYIFVLLAIILIVGAYFLFFYTPAPAGIPQAPAPAEDQAVRTYTNDVFGVSFQYDSTQVGVLQQGTSSIAVYATGTSPAEGQSIARFGKLQGETLEQSIQRQVLSGYSTSTCIVELTSLPSSYIKAEISYPVPDESPLGHEAQCNASYDKTSGIRYFLYDPAHADRFYFINIGQYPLPATPGHAWQDTINIQ